MKKIALLLVVASFACSGDSVGPLSDSGVPPDLLTATADPGNGAIVSRVSDAGTIVVTGDPNSGLLSFHYSSSSFFEFVAAVALGQQCPDIPTFEETLDVQSVQLPNGQEQLNVSGPAFVRVLDMAGFPANFCNPIAQGPISFHGTLRRDSSPPNAPGMGSYVSNGVITNSSDGSDVRLHHTAKDDGTGAFPTPGTIRLQ